MSYYDRSSVTHIDGTQIFQNAADRRSEQEVSKILETRWRMFIRSFGALSPVDWYAEQAGRMVGILELKSRSHESRKYPTVFLNVRKWLALTLGSVGLGVPAVFVVRFVDGIRWISLTNIDATKHGIAGCSRIVKSANDIEPVIHVSISDMTPLEVTQ